MRENGECPDDANLSLCLHFIFQEHFAQCIGHFISVFQCLIFSSHSYEVANTNEIFLILREAENFTIYGLIDLDVVEIFKLIVRSYIFGKIMHIPCEHFSFQGSLNQFSTENLCGLHTSFFPETYV